MPKIDYDALKRASSEKLIALEEQTERSHRREIEQKRFDEEEAARKKRKKRKRKQRKAQ